MSIHPSGDLPGVGPVAGPTGLAAEGVYAPVRAPVSAHPYLRTGAVILARIVLALFGLFAFLLGIQLMRVLAGVVQPLVEAYLIPLTQQPWDALSFGWLAAYAILSGSPVAAFSLVLLDAGQIGVETTYFMIMGSRLGAVMIVLLIGAVSLARGKPREKSLAMGVLSFLVTYSIYLPAILVGFLLIRLGVLTWFEIETPQFFLDYFELVFQPFLSPILAYVPAFVGFLAALAAIYIGLALFDRAFGRREEQELRSPRMHNYLKHPGVAFAVGAAVTLASTSVSLSLGLLVPLYLNGYIDRRSIVPYIMGANITTFVDTLLASLVLGGGAATNLVILEMVVVTLFSILALATYRGYSGAIDRLYTRIFHSNWALGGFIVALFAAPIVLLLFV